MSEIFLFKAHIDWFTATSFEPEFYQYWERRLSREGGSKESKILQYVGKFYNLDGGSCFLGSGDQNGRYHSMLRVSGQLADKLFKPLKSQVRQNFVTVTRLDIQSTIPEPAQWSQWTLFNRLKKLKHWVGWVESGGAGAGNLETVYCGKRTSNRMTRIYVKLDVENTRLLRLETEYKAERSNAIAREIAQHGILPDMFLIHELENVIKDDQLTKAFRPGLMGDQPYNIKIRLASSMEKRRTWLLRQVLPAFVEYINSHESNVDVALAFAQAIDKTLNDQRESGY